MKRHLLLGMLTGAALVGLTQPISGSSLSHTLANVTTDASTLPALPSPPLLAQTGSSATSSATPSTPASSLQPGSLTLLNQGAEPRQIVQLRPAIDTHQKSVMTLQMQGSMTAPGMAQTLPGTPTTTMTLATDVIDIDAFGNRHIEFKYTDVTVDETASDLPAEAVTAMRSQLSQLEGLHGSWVLTDQGYISQFTMIPPDTMSPLMAQSLQQMVDSLQQLSAPLPSEAIGIGAQWQMPYAASINGVDLEGLVTYELLSHTNDQITLSTTVEQQGTSTGLEAMGLPSTIDVGVQQIEASGQGIIAMDLNQIMPIQSDMTMTSNSQFTVSHQGVDIPVAMTLLINMTLLSDEP